MRAKVQKWGNSLALRIPRAFAQEVALDEGTIVDLSLEQGAVLVRPVRTGESLEELLSRVTPENLHGEVDLGVAVGSETW